MQAAIGDRFHVRGNMAGQPKRTGEIIEVRRAGAEPPYPVRFDDGHTDTNITDSDVNAAREPPI